ncbi:alanine/ornithine racemase family PLP-dependent enzyme [Paracrocinitomix mangrovi]|uniref:alanine racemase n=1 Tax=Paracrocinitomix mangrovi TaxID=2862509 RepID=UPI001C8D5347|nr:alanine/ornithine racemase family PLP-dependent enzyme [Paracrocinitomix mangrovi]UKN01398.1 alanine/ornithine racemase family PLP-dependent enzyme [Paracrocinitomix mangrovi]
MAYIELHKDKLKQNFNYLDRLFKEEGRDWAVVSKILCGNEKYLKELIDLGVNEICDARISNLKMIKELNPDIDTVYIKPPAKDHIEDVVKYADASFNTELETIKWISEEAVKQGKLHKIIIMIELGDLREGVMGGELIDFYESIFKLPGIKVTGIGTNLNCVSGVYPSQDKLVQLCLYEQLIEAKFGRKIPWVTGGTSVVLPLLFKKQVPKGVNHFRVGESLFFGNDLWTEETIEGMGGSVFKLFTQIIEINEKPKVPVGYLGQNPSGETVEFTNEDYGVKSYRALLDLGVLDVSNTDFLVPQDKRLELIGGSSDMLVLDLGDAEDDYKVGDFVTFDLKYMGALRLLNSDYIDKKIVTH